MVTNQIILNRLHSVLLEILFQIDTICRDHNISYFLDSGSALGAVRHGGFIPWDDDIDVGMLREDYDRFLAIAPRCLDERFFLLTREVDDSYKQYHAKLVREFSVFPEEGNDKLVHKGIFIDLFPFDRIPNSRIKAKFRFIAQMNVTSLLRIKRQSIQSKSLSGRIMSLLLSFWSIESLERRRYRIWTGYNSQDTENVTCYLYKMQNRRRFLFFPADSLYPVKEISFEGHSFMIMNDTHSYLTIMYGDYMELPPMEKRETHLKEGIVFPEK